MCDEPPVPRLALRVWPDFGQAMGFGRRKSYEVAREIGVRVDGRLIVPVKTAEAWLEGLRAAPRSESP